VGYHRPRELAAEAIVAAAGPWNPRVAAMAGVDLPAHHSLAPAVVLERDGAGGTAVPIVTHVESGAYARDHGDGRVLVAHYPTDRDPETQFDPGEVGDAVPEDVRGEMEAFLADLLPSLADAREVAEWVGVRSHTPDGHPIAGWTGVEGFSIAAFHSSGIQLAPAVGRVVAEQLVRGEPTELYESLSISRFDGREDARFSIS
jgi:glycine/D-amino acid oxidase-like deaminating enzyme